MPDELRKCPACHKPCTVAALICESMWAHNGMRTANYKKSPSRLELHTINVRGIHREVGRGSLRLTEAHFKECHRSISSKFMR